MLMPTRVKYRKSQRGRMKGCTKAGAFVSFGEFGLQALEAHWITARQIEAVRVTLARFLKKGGKVWIRIFPPDLFQQPKQSAAAEKVVQDAKIAFRLVTTIFAGTVTVFAAIGGLFRLLEQIRWENAFVLPDDFFQFSDSFRILRESNIALS
jgi:ribosomal protein L16